jgi:cytochrome c-type biogenesis protein CcmH
MLLWLTLAMMTVAALFAVLWPLARGTAAVRSGSDVAIYRDQLDEIDRDQAAGRIGKAEADAARVEVSRRLATAADTTEAAPAVDAAPATLRRRAVALATLLLLPAGAGALYLSLGSPAIPTLPLASRQDALTRQQSVETMVAQVEAFLENNPENGRGWEVLAPIYLRLGRHEDAVKAWRNAIRLLGETAERMANLGEALVAAADDKVTPEAKAVFERAVALDAKTVSARFYLGLAAEQDGKREEAAKIWRELIAGAPADAHWVAFVRVALARVEDTPVERQPAIVAPNPSAREVEIATTPEPDRQAAMIRGMVDRLAQRLQADGSDLDGWLRLVRSYRVLGEVDKAQAAAADARRALASDTDKLRRFDEAMKAPDLGG